MGSGIANSRPVDSSRQSRVDRATRSRSAHSRADNAQALPIVIPVGVVGAIGMIAAIAALIADPPDAVTVIELTFLLAASAAAEAFPLPIEGVNVGSTSLAIVFIVATAVLYGWPEAAVVGFLTMALVELARRRSTARIVFNTGLYVCAAILAALTASLASGDDLGSLVAGACLGATAFYLVDMIFLSAVVARTRKTSFFRSLGSYVYSTFVPFLVMASLSVTLILLWDRSPFVSVVVVGPLITVALYERWLHRALDRLREFDRLKDEFIAVISHELRTPLTSVYGAALTLQKREVDDEMREALLAIVSDEAGRLARLLDDALSASRLHADRETFDIEATDGVEIARAVLDATSQRLPEGFALELAAPDAATVSADPDKLRQVFVNLTENAIKYSPRGGTIELRVEPSSSFVRFSVRDEGIGIPEKDQAHVFDRFYRVDPNMTQGVGGTGLGLYICRELVERMSGRIWLTSREGHGSTFTFELPAAPA